MSFNNPFNFNKRPAKTEMPAPSESKEGDPEQALSSLLADLDSAHGVAQTDQALDRLFGDGSADIERSMTNFPPVSDDLIKRLEPLSSQFGQQAVLRSLGEQRLARKGAA